jgi:hypothetical protein
MNADRLTPDALQALMRHKSYLTTQIYINMAPQIDEAVAGLHVPEVLREESNEGTCSYGVFLETSAACTFWSFAVSLYPAK